MLFCFFFSAVGPYSEVEPRNAYPCVSSQALRCSAEQDALILLPAVIEILVFLYTCVFQWSSITDGCGGEGICKEDLKSCMYDFSEVMFTFKKKKKILVPGFGGAQSSLTKEKVTI